MRPNLNHHQWKLIYTAVRKQQKHEMCGSKWYDEYTEVLNELYDLAYSETYIEKYTEATPEDWTDFWESDGPEQSNNMY